MKRFLLKLTLYSSPFLVLLVVFICTYHVYYTHAMSPTDLTLLGMRMDDKSYYYSFDTLSVDYLCARYRYSEQSKLRDSATIWIFGDSFTQKGGNRIYANYVARNLPNKKICLIKFQPGSPYSPIDQFVQMAHKEVLPPYVIVSSVERALIDRLLNLSLSENDSLNNLMRTYIRPPFKEKSITEKSIEYYKKQLNIDNAVKTTDLKIDAFSYPGRESELLFLGEDLSYRYSNEDMNKAISTINELFQFAQKHGTKLIFLVCPDKFDMYQKYLVTGSKYFDQKERTLDYVSGNVAIKDFVNAKQLLLPYIDKGVKDIYYYNDTHWSPKASEIVAESLCKYLN